MTGVRRQESESRRRRTEVSEKMLEVGGEALIALRVEAILKGIEHGA